MLTWGVVGLLMIGVYGQRALGAVLINTDRVGERWQRALQNLPLAIIAAVVGLQTLTANQRLVIDERLGGLAVAALCAWRKLPLLVTVVAAAGTTAFLRQVV